MPDLVISDRQVGKEDRGLRFDVNTSNTNQEEVKKFIESKFPGELAMNKLTIANLGPAMPKKAAPLPPAKEEIKVIPPEPEKTPEKGRNPIPPGTEKPAEKSAPGKTIELPAPADELVRAGRGRAAVLRPG